MPNSRNGVDVDKFDYLKRDSLNTLGLAGHQFDYMRLMNNAAVVEDQVCISRQTTDDYYYCYYCYSYYRRSLFLL